MRHIVWKIQHSLGNRLDRVSQWGEIHEYLCNLIRNFVKVVTVSCSLYLQCTGIVNGFQTLGLGHLAGGLWLKHTASVGMNKG